MLSQFLPSLCFHLPLLLGYAVHRNYLILKPVSQIRRLAQVLRLIARAARVQIHEPYCNPHVTLSTADSYHHYQIKRFNVAKS
jgi:hypothetical protein